MASIYLCILLLLLPLSSSFGYETCPITGAICPEGNLCCQDTTTTAFPTTRCLSVGIHASAESAMCCTDDVTTGCGEGFVCGRRTSTNDYGDDGATNEMVCIATDPEEDELPNVVPRTKLCSVSSNMTHTYGLPMIDTRTSHPVSQLRNQESIIPVAAYLSTHGAIHEVDSVVFDKVKRAVILIHGSGRNPDDYICCTSAAIPNDLQDSSSVLIVAPWFAAPDDGGITITPTTSQQQQELSVLRWSRNIAGVEHTWRYGAPSIINEDDNNTHVQVSSFDVVDRFLELHLFNTTKFPSLEQIVVTGHSAGGQFVQRWALLSPIIPNSAAAGASSSAQQHHPTSTTDTTTVPIRIVVANPKSYAYLDARRWIATTTDPNHNSTLEFRIPDATMIESHCPTYNEWLWGLDNSTNLVVPYLHMSIQKAGGVDAMIQRYSQRTVVYLAGEQDILWNGNCEANVQGPNRLQRSQRFYASLDEIYATNQNRTSTTQQQQQHRQQRNHVHERFVIPDVNHNHCLMYQSRQGQQALFAGPDTSSRSDYHRPQTDASIASSER